MIKEVIYQHKLEKEQFVLRNYIAREGIDDAKKSLNTNMLKVIIGPRRAGKSVFSFLLLKNKDFAYVNFDDEKLLKLKDYDDLIKSIFEVYPNSKFILFDEIQNLVNWELFVNKLQRRGYNLIITGSNSKLLDKELSRVLTGRYIPITLLPFSFKEFLYVKEFSIKENELHNPETKGKLFNNLNNYLVNGGYPEIVVNKLETKPYLETLFGAILFKDIVIRNKVKFSQQLYDLAIYLIANICSEYSFSSLRKTLGFGSTLTIQKYIKYLEESYLFFSLNRFSFKMKEQIKAPKKIYVVDNGFIVSKAFQVSSNNSKLIENLVFIELLRKGYKPNENIFYYKTRNKKEVDFVIKKGISIESLIQVCYDIFNERTKKREINSLLESSEELKCSNLVIITYDYEAEEIHDKKTVRFTPLWKWLLEV